jgi:hypothetical protein
MPDDHPVFSVRLISHDGKPISGRLVIVFLDSWGLPGPTLKTKTGSDGRAHFRTYGSEETGKILTYRSNNDGGSKHQVLLADRQPICNGTTLSFVVRE